MIPLIETAMGVENAFQIASADERVAAMFLGGEDLTADLRCKENQRGQRNLLCPHPSGMRCPRLRHRRIRHPIHRRGRHRRTVYRRQLCKEHGLLRQSIHLSRHVEGINEVFSPTQAEIDYAHEVMETIRIAKEQGKGVVSLRGKMIDAPIVERARQVIEMEKAMFGEVEDDE